MLDERVLAVLARLEDEDAAEREAGLPASAALAPGGSRRPGASCSRWRRARPVSRSWRSAARAATRRSGSRAGARVLGGRLVSLEHDPVECAAWRANVADAGLDEWAELVEGDALRDARVRPRTRSTSSSSTPRRTTTRRCSASRDRCSSRAVSWSPTTCSRTWRHSARTRLHARPIRRFRASRCRSTAASSCPSCCRLPDLRHQAVEVAVGVAEERHPELVVGHARDEMRLVLELDTTRRELGARCADVVDAEIQRRARVIELVATPASSASGARLRT